MKTDDNELRRLIGQWREVEPAPDFNDRVWHRIRSSEPAPFHWRNRIRAWVVPEPIWAAVAAVILGLFIGAAAGLRPGGSAGTDFALLKPGTVSGNYVLMISGGAQ